MNVNSVEKHEIVMLNVKLQVKVRFKTFYWVLELLFTNFILGDASITACFDRRFCMFGNKSVIYRPKLNL